MMDGDFFVGAALSTTLTKLALRYISLVSDPKRQNMVLAEAMLIMASIIHFGKSGLSTKVRMNSSLFMFFSCTNFYSCHISPTTNRHRIDFRFCLQPITDDDVDRIAVCLRVLGEKLPMMGDIFTDSCRQSLASMLHAKAKEEKEYQKVYCVVALFICSKETIK